MSKKKMDHYAQHLMMALALKENVSHASGPALYFLDQVVSFVYCTLDRKKKLCYQQAIKDHKKIPISSFRISNL